MESSFQKNGLGSMRGKGAVCPRMHIGVFGHVNTRSDSTCKKESYRQAGFFTHRGYGSLLCQESARLQTPGVLFRVRYIRGCVPPHETSRVLTAIFERCCRPASQGQPRSFDRVRRGVSRFMGRFMGCSRVSVQNCRFHYRTVPRYHEVMLTIHREYSTANLWYHTCRAEP